MKSEYATWREELEPPPRLTIAERVARWFERSPKPPEPEMFVWHDVSVLLSGDGEG